jgi:hypothetical protein
MAGLRLTAGSGRLRDFFLDTNTMPSTSFAAVAAACRAVPLKGRTGGPEGRIGVS